MKLVELPSAIINNTFRFEKLNNNLTIVEYETIAKGGASFTDGGLSQQIEDQETLNKFKNVVENYNPSKCYIATAVYGDINHPSVIVLRKYRDNSLSNYILGKGFINIYYSVSPKLIKYINSNNWIKQNIKIVLDKLVTRILK